MRKLFSRARGWTILAGIAALSATSAITRSSSASDHQDTPEVELSPRMDVNDVYAFPGASADRIRAGNDDLVADHAGAVVSQSSGVSHQAKS